ncbi:cardiolipin synthase [Clostridia bacterium]|nr:cardiolipin synthase [Clostridia bacterium]
MRAFGVRNINRIVITGVGVIIQLLIYFSMLSAFNDYSNWFYGFSIAISVFVVLWIINNDSNPSYKMAWIILIMLAPVFGGIFYLEFGNNRMSKRERKSMCRIDEATLQQLPKNDDIINNLMKIDKPAALQSRYIQNFGGYAAATDSAVEYLSIGEEYFEELKIELKKARHFIFLEYFIIENGTMWNQILQILVQKVKEGVDVRIIYDDFGCMLTLPVDYKMELESMGIQCMVFNKLVPLFSFRFNTRDHRKIAVIDNASAFTGGINLADEYINARERFGHWKDGGIKICGEAVWHFTVMFLSMWDYLAGTKTDYDSFKLNAKPTSLKDSNGVIQPFSDSPLDNEPVGQNVYLNLISKAQDYIYITTPYLVIDDGMMNNLTNAAKSGVDVRIMTPHIPDKKYVHEVTKSYYPKLVQSGVKIYEYTPGFIHCKSFVVDDIYGIVGTINMDYRSLYLHFECGVWTCRTGLELELKNDFLKTQERCTEVSEETLSKLGIIHAFIRMILKAFAPLM